MSVKNLLDELGDEVESSKDEPYEVVTPVERPNAHGARVLSVRFSEADFADLCARAEAENLPVSTMARVLVTRQLAGADLASVLRATLKPELLRDAA